MRRMVELGGEVDDFPAEKIKGAIVKHDPVRTLDFLRQGPLAALPGGDFDRGQTPGGQPVGL